MIKKTSFERVTLLTLVWYKPVIKSEIEAFSKYIDHVESTITEEFLKLKNQIDQYEGDEQELYVDYMYDEIVTYRDDFPAIMRSSILISIYTYLEHELNRFCRYHNADGFKNYDSRDRGIERAKNFIKDELNMKFPDQTKSWQFINSVREIRNSFAHANGYIDQVSNPIKLRNVIDLLGKDLVSESSGTIRKIKLEETFNKEFIKHVTEFLDNLYELISPPVK
ncbi:hypothetical protein KSS88_04160 [Bacillus altitudinis]|nr:hypothetical protein [Bacillus altitudinis]MBU8968023.1 hypothetical protein [Bacillus altitudinis]